MSETDEGWWDALDFIFIRVGSKPYKGKLAGGQNVSSTLVWRIYVKTPGRLFQSRFFMSLHKYGMTP